MAEYFVEPANTHSYKAERVLEVQAAWQHPLAITTKGTLIERDIDILAPMAARGLAQTGVWRLNTMDAGPLSMIWSVSRNYRFWGAIEVFHIVRWRCARTNGNSPYT